MTAASAALDRFGAWTSALEGCGYGVVRRWLSASEFEIHAERPESYGAPHVVIDIAESWADGLDPVNHVQRSHQGAYLVAGKAHAQIVPGETGAHRVDVGDPSKPAQLTIHLHPIGKENDHRIPQCTIPVPEQWVDAIEAMAADVADGVSFADVKF